MSTHCLGEKYHKHGPSKEQQTCDPPLWREKISSAHASQRTTKTKIFNRFLLKNDVNNIKELLIIIIKNCFNIKELLIIITSKK